MPFLPRLLLLVFFAAQPLGAVAADFLPGVTRIVFLGDSITHAGAYVDAFAKFLFLRFPDRPFEVINVGLPSETVSGLSEDGHADGKFPRPDLHERLDRVLAKTKPDLIFACYGMNDGIYLPLDEARFAKFREGIERLAAKATAAYAQLILLTPPAFHPLAARTPSGAEEETTLGGYNLVLDRYASWLLEQRARGWTVIDIHGPMNAFIDDQRKTEPDFVFAKDGVHPNAAGHAVMAEALIGGLAPAELDWWRKEQAREFFQTTSAKSFSDAIRQRGRILTDAWLADIGHTRPGMAKGLPLAEAQAKATLIEEEIRARSRPIVPQP